MHTPAQIRNAWDQLASGYDQFVTPTHLPLAEKSLRIAGLRPGMKFLDVAAGSGALSLPAAQMGAQVVATDISPRMIEQLNIRARANRLPNLEGHVMDAHALDFEDDSFDISGSLYGVMLVPDLPRAMREMRRVTRPGGRVLIITFAPPPQVEFLRFFLSAMKTVIPDFVSLPMDPPPLPFQVSDPDKLHHEMREAGLRDIRIETTSHGVEYESAEDLWKWVINSNPIGAGWVADLNAEQETAVKRVLDDMLRERAGENKTAVLINQSNIGVGSV